MAGGQVFAPSSPASGRITPASFPFYTTGEDAIRVTSWNSAAGVALTINGRLLEPDGTPKAVRWNQTPNTDRSALSSDFQFSNTTLLNLTVFASAGAPQMGQTFVRVQLIRGLGAAAIVLGTILQGGVTANQALGFPGSALDDTSSGGGYIRTIQGTTPGLGVDTSETVPTGARWEVIGFTAVLHTDATVVTRNPRLAIKQGVLFIVFSPSTLGSAGGLQTVHSWGQGLSADAPLSTNVGVGGLPVSMTLLAGQRIGTDTENMQAGDNWEAPVYTVREWLDI